MGPRHCPCERDDDPTKAAIPKCARKVINVEEMKVLDKSKMTMKTAPTKRKILSLEDKMEVLDKHKLGWSSCNLGRLFGVKESTVRYIVKIEDKIRNDVAITGSEATKQVRTIKDPALCKMEKALFLLIQDSYKKGIVLNSQAIRRKAVIMYRKIVKAESSPLLKQQQEDTTPDNNHHHHNHHLTPKRTSLYHKFSASSSWYCRFKLRYPLNNFIHLNEGKSAKPKAPFQQNHDHVTRFQQKQKAMALFLQDNEDVAPFQQEQKGVAPFQQDNEHVIPFQQERKAVATFLHDHRYAAPFLHDHKYSAPFPKRCKTSAPFPPHDFEGFTPEEQRVVTAAEQIWDLARKAECMCVKDTSRSISCGTGSMELVTSSEETSRTSSPDNNFQGFSDADDCTLDTAMNDCVMEEEQTSSEEEMKIDETTTPQERVDDLRQHSGDIVVDEIREFLVGTGKTLFDSEAMDVVEDMVIEEKVLGQSEGEEKMMGQSVSGGKVMEGSVSEGKVMGQGVSEGKVVGQSVNEKVVEKSVSGDKKLGQSVKEKEVDQTVSEEKVMGQSVSEGTIMEQSVSGDKKLGQSVKEKEVDQTVSEEKVMGQSVSEGTTMEQSVNTKNTLEQTVSEEKMDQSVSEKMEESVSKEKGEDHQDKQAPKSKPKKSVKQKKSGQGVPQRSNIKKPTQSTPNRTSTAENLFQLTPETSHVAEFQGVPEKSLTPENLCQAMRIASQLKQFFYSIDPSMVRAFEVMAGIDQVLTPYRSILDKMLRKQSRLPMKRFFHRAKEQRGIPASPLNPS